MKYLLLVSVSIFALVFGFVELVPIAQAGILDGLGLSNAGFGGGILQAGITSGLGVTILPFSAILIRLMQWMLSLVSIFAIIAFVISGFMYLTSAGDEEQAKIAKKAFTYALIGLIVAISGLVVIRAVSRWMMGQSIF